MIRIAASAAGGGAAGPVAYSEARPVNAPVNAGCGVDESAFRKGHESKGRSNIAFHPTRASRIGSRSRVNATLARRNEGRS